MKGLHLLTCVIESYCIIRFTTPAKTVCDVNIDVGLGAGQFMKKTPEHSMSHTAIESKQKFVKSTTKSDYYYYCWRIPRAL